MTDRAFLKNFSGLIAVLVALSVLLFAVAQMIGKKPAAEDAKAVAERIKPVGEVYVANTTPAKKANAVLDAIVPVANAAGDGKSLFNQVCQACHAAGVAGAPKFGDKKAWAPRIAQGKDVLYQHALHGFQGKSGVMPPKGGSAAPDAQVKAAVDYMVNAAEAK
jgi:cytochrome c5